MNASFSSRALLRQGLSAALLAACVWTASCGSSPSRAPQEGSAPVDSVAVDSLLSLRDSTVYGRADGFGQSGLTLITQQGKELELTLTAERALPHEGAVWGARSDTAQYAVTTREGGEAVAVLVNVSQLRRFISQPRLHNGRLVLTTEGRERACDFLELSDTLLRVRTSDGMEITQRPR